MEHQSLLGVEKRPLTPTPTPKDGITVDPELVASIELEAQRLRERQIRKRKCRRFLHFLTIATLFGLVLWVKHGGAAGTMSKVGVFYYTDPEGDHRHDHDHQIHIPRGVTLLQCTNWDGQDDLAPPPDSPYPLPMESLPSLFPPGNPSEVNGGGCDPSSRSSHKGKFRGASPVLSRMRRSASSADFTFPLNNTEKGEENKFFFISRGYWSAGRVNVFQKGVGSLHGCGGAKKAAAANTATEATTLGAIKERDGEVKVHVGIEYLDERYLEYVKVCKIAVNTGKEGEEAKVSTGVGIFTPEGHRGRHRRRRHDRPEPFDVTIEFPGTSSSKDAKSKPVTITEFISDFPLFSQTLGDLKNVYFEKLVVASVNEPLKSTALWGDKLILSTVNAAISGTFKALKAVVLVTKNAPIEAEIELVQTPDAVNSTIAELLTTNGRINANTTLTSTSKEGTGGNFTVGLATVKAPINLTFPSAPINNTLYLDASTILSPVNINLHPTYEGTFSLKTLLASTTLNAKRDPEGDPEGKGRSRGLDVFQHGCGRLEGVTWWNEERKNSSHVKIKSTLSPIILDL